MANKLLPLPSPLGLPFPIRHRTFAFFFADPELDPSHGVYARVMELFDPEVNLAGSYVHLLEQAIGSNNVPQAYLCCL